MNGKKAVCIAVALIIALNCAGIAMLYRKVNQMAAEQSVAWYTLYVGLNDKDSYRQEISDEDTIKIIYDVCSSHTDGFTVWKANGMWVDEKEIATYENTIVCRFYETDESTIHHIADELIRELNQNTILIEKSAGATEYYSGQ